jgi:hypothetical protein
MTASPLLVKIAFRNVFRNKRRTLLTLMILIMGSTGLILVGGFFDNIMGGLREQFIPRPHGAPANQRKGLLQKRRLRPLSNSWSRTFPGFNAKSNGIPTSL